jgi:hypothetical protein
LRQINTTGNLRMAAMCELPVEANELVGSLGCVAAGPSSSERARWQSPLTAIARRQSDDPFCDGAHDKAGGDITRPMCQQDYPGCNQSRADAPDRMALPCGKRTGRGSQRPDVDGMARMEMHQAACLRTGYRASAPQWFCGRASPDQTPSSGCEAGPLRQAWSEECGHLHDAPLYSWYSCLDNRATSRQRARTEYARPRPR